MKKSIIALIAFVMLSVTAIAQQTSKTRISLEIDPATFVWKGYSAHLRIQPAHSKHFQIGAGVYSMEMPDFLVDLNSHNKGKGWNAKIKLGYGIFAEYYFSEVNKGWFAGGQTSMQTYTVSNNNFTGEADHTNFLVMGYAGYSWKPFSNNDLYVKPWAGIGSVSRVSGTTTIADNKYNVAPVTMFATLHIGYTF